MNKPTFKIVFISLVACLFIIACKTERDPCLQPVNVQVKMEFKRRVADTGTAIIDTNFVNMLMNPLDSPRHFVDTGSIIGSANPSLLYIRLSPLADSCRWYIQPDSAQPSRRDTITFFYQRQLHFISNACGYSYYFNIDSLHFTRRSIADQYHSIDSITITTPFVNGDANKTHLRIYFHKP